MRCQRCESEMISDRFMDLGDDTGRFVFRGWRCMICGNISDPVISSNRSRRPPPVFRKNKKLIIGVN